MTKQKESISLRGVSLTGKSYMMSEKGFYLQGFNTTLNHLTTAHLKNYLNYGRDLVSRYEQLDPRLIQFKLIHEEQNLSTVTEVHSVRTGAIVAGKLYVTVQILNEDDVKINYNYRFRTSSEDFFNRQPNLNPSITGANSETMRLKALGQSVSKGKGDRGRFSNHKYVRIRNKNESKRRKYKEY